MDIGRQLDEVYVEPVVEPVELEEADEQLVEAVPSH
jgi:hypothetical protein